MKIHEIRFLDSIGGCRSAIGKVDEYQMPLRGVELENAANMVPGRLREYVAGRTLARSLLAELSGNEHEIPASPDRYPIWPEGFCGSISHSGNVVAATVARSLDYPAIGIDLEAKESVTPDIADVVLTSGEKDISANTGDKLDPTVFFSCKESFYKAVYPLTHDRLEFQDVSVSLQGTDRFSVDVLPDCRSKELAKSGYGVFGVIDGYVVTAFLVRNPAAST